MLWREAVVMRILLVVAVSLLLGALASGHHSFAAYYFEEQTVTIEGDVAEFDYRAPHAWLYVMAPDAQGQVQRFSAEWANPRRLTGDGITRDKLKAGDRVIITGSPGRTPLEYKIHLKRIQRPADGWTWSGARRGGRRRYASSRRAARYGAPGNTANAILLSFSLSGHQIRPQVNGIGHRQSVHLELSRSS
jgi:hypothetical protein